MPRQIKWYDSTMVRSEAHKIEELELTPKQRLEIRLAEAKRDLAEAESNKKTSRYILGHLRDNVRQLEWNVNGNNGIVPPAEPTIARQHKLF